VQIGLFERTSLYQKLISTSKPWFILQYEKLVFFLHSKWKLSFLLLFRNFDHWDLLHLVPIHVSWYDMPCSLDIWCFLRVRTTVILLLCVYSAAYKQTESQLVPYYTVLQLLCWLYGSKTWDEVSEIWYSTRCYRRGVMIESFIHWLLSQECLTCIRQKWAIEICISVSSVGNV
jgi:hypothetical protein